MEQEESEKKEDNSSTSKFDNKNQNLPTQKDLPVHQETKPLVPDFSQDIKELNTSQGQSFTSSKKAELLIISNNDSSCGNNWPKRPPKNFRPLRKKRKPRSQPTSKHSNDSNPTDSLPKADADYISKTEYLFLLDKVSDLSNIIVKLNSRINELEDRAEVQDHYSSAGNSMDIDNMMLNSAKAATLKTGSNKVTPIGKI